MLCSKKLNYTEMQFLFFKLMFFSKTSGRAIMRRPWLFVIIFFLKKPWHLGKELKEAFHRRLLTFPKNQQS